MADLYRLVPESTCECGKVNKAHVCKTDGLDHLREELVAKLIKEQQGV